MAARDPPQARERRDVAVHGEDAVGHDELPLCGRAVARGFEELTVLLNTVGDAESRRLYREALQAFLEPHRDRLGSDSRRRLDSNPLRILDSKNLQVQALLEEAPKLSDYIDEDSQAHFETLCALLDAAGLDYDINPHLVRGLDYYGRTVFEWVTDQLGAQGTVCAGGRYDVLMEYLGGRATPAVGFALGLERIIALLENQGTRLPDALPHLYIVTVGAQAQRQGLLLSERLRDALPKLRIVTHCGGGSFKSQFKKADRSGARYALVLGEDEVQRREIGIKPLREREDQETVSYDALDGRLAQLIDW